MGTSLKPGSHSLIRSFFPFLTHIKFVPTSRSRTEALKVWSPDQRVASVGAYETSMFGAHPSPTKTDAGVRLMRPHIWEPLTQSGRLLPLPTAGPAFLPQASAQLHSSGRPSPATTEAHTPTPPPHVLCLALLYPTRCHAFLWILFCPQPPLAHPAGTSPTCLQKVLTR